MGGELRQGDKVRWRGGWGSDPEREAEVTGIDRVEPGEKYGTRVQSMSWVEVVRDPSPCIVALDNGHWAYGYQLRPIVEGDNGQG